MERTTMKGQTLNILLGPLEVADLLQVPESTINAAIEFGFAPRPTWSPNRKKLRWKESDLPGWMRSLDRLRGQRTTS